jgi:hypothetical protein
MASSFSGIWRLNPPSPKTARGPAVCASPHPISLPCPPPARPSSSVILPPRPFACAPRRCLRRRVAQEPFLGRSWSLPHGRCFCHRVAHEPLSCRWGATARPWIGRCWPLFNGRVGGAAVCDAAARRPLSDTGLTARYRCVPHRADVASLPLSWWPPPPSPRGRSCLRRARARSPRTSGTRCRCVPSPPHRRLLCTHARLPCACVVWLSHIQDNEAFVVLPGSIPELLPFWLVDAPFAVRVVSY